jgi:hypothetical protein
LGILFLCFGIASVAAADPVVLTAGGMFVSPSGSSISFGGSGSGFSAFGSGSGSGFETGFNAGDTVALSQQIFFTPTLADPGSATSDGVTHAGYLGGSLQFSATPFVAGSSSGGQEIITPFTMSGVLRLFAQPGQTALLTENVTATGFAVFSARSLGNGFYLADRGLGLTFESAPIPSATPEPASLLLLATGVAPLVLRRRRQP